MRPLEIMDIQMPEQSQAEPSLQRSEEWVKQRLGRFTGSQIDELMSCSRASAKYEWGRPEKLIDLGDTAKKYIFAKAKERQRGKVIQATTSYAMKYGTEQESTVWNILLKKYPRIQKTGFIEFISGVAGASPDGAGSDFGIEIKCVTDWDGLYKRHIEPFDQSHDDFWQIQSEMLALECKKLLYAVAEPSENIFEPNITDISEKWVEASPIHQQAIIQRCKLGDMIIKKYLSGVEWHEAVRQGCEGV